MLNRNTIAALAVALSTSAATAPVFADDAGARTAQRLVQEARNYGKSEPRGTAAGETERAERERTAEQRVSTNPNHDRWEAILRQQSRGN